MQRILNDHDLGWFDAESSNIMALYCTGSSSGWEFCWPYLIRGTRLLEYFSNADDDRDAAATRAQLRGWEIDTSLLWRGYRSKCFFD